MNINRSELRKISFGNQKLNCYRKPNGEYRFDLKQISQYAGYNDDWLSNVLRRQGLTYQELIDNGLSPKNLKEALQVESNTRSYNCISISLQNAVAIFRYAAKQGKPEAQAIYDAALSEKLERAADLAYGEIKTEEERNQLFERRRIEQLKSQFPKRHRQIEEYHHQGKTADWIETRLWGTEECQSAFKKELLARQVNNFGIAKNTNAIYQGITDHKASELKKIHFVDIAKDGLSKLELAAVNLAQLASVREIEQINAQGNSQTYSICKDKAKKVRSAIV
ncbi:hypothetical protein [Geminocystis sp. GBBB08]|uniref:hypothetical protein n=1 Tax=Geminocystis sp. GBBB08 TaxID=2604140 RepID=UPI0027E38EE7|nr:hypothetical protein [Geminocystis sp. GBBB08]MBL1209120.1 hypothetical protein [Geminocystis sp. GBBB08]